MVTLGVTRGPSERSFLELDHVLLRRLKLSSAGSKLGELNKSADALQSNFILLRGGQKQRKPNEGASHQVHECK
jgi:hypothetical protein